MKEMCVECGENRPVDMFHELCADCYDKPEASARRGPDEPKTSEELHIAHIMSL
jgi:NMD protein affecting ribosome stability and mRNA decay